MNDSVELVLLPPLLKRLSREAPQVRIELRPWGRHEIPEGVARGEIDLALGWFGSPPAAHRRERLFAEQFVCIVRRDHPKVGKKLSLGTWASLPHVVVSATTDRTSIDRALERKGLSRTIALRVSHVLLVPSLVAETDWAAAISSRVAERFARSLRLAVHPLPLDLPPSTASMTWHERNDADPAQVFLRRVVAEVAQSL